ncbi:hypothetical protein FVQ98_17590 [Ottowia sp. GY511]|nr:hypothetical protein FVQ98_17590 [Ottowia sp. GY511]
MQSLRELTGRGCLNGALEERAVSSAAHPVRSATQVCPAAQQRGRRRGVAFSLPTFFWRSKRKWVGRRAETRPPSVDQQQPPHKHAAQELHIP